MLLDMYCPKIGMDRYKVRLRLDASAFSPMMSIAQCSLEQGDVLDAFSQQVGD